MVTCKTYTYQVNEKSPLNPLVLAMKADGVTDAERDGGYAQIDYLAPWKPAKIVGAGDCFIDEREDLERGLKNWRRYKKPLTEYYGVGRLMWDFDNELYNPSAPEKDASKGDLFMDRARLAIGEIRNGLARQKLDPKSDEYRQKMAEALFYFHLFPLKTKWASYDGRQRAEVLAVLRRLDTLGLKRFKNYLIKNGGGDNFYAYAISLKSEYNPTGFGFTGSIPHTASELFAIFEEAGLEPTFMELTDNSPENFVCGMPTVVKYGVGIELANGWRVFDVYDRNPDVKKGLVYPLNLRQTAGTSRAMSQFFDVLISRTPSETDFEKVFSADGFSSNYSTFSNFLVELLKKDDRQAMELFEGYIRKHKSEFHPLLGVYLEIVLSHGKKDQQPAVSQGPAENFVWLLNNNDATEENAGRALPLARALLSVDPKCFLAHAVIAKIGTAGLGGISDAEIEDHYSKAFAAIPAGDNTGPSLKVIWGEFYLKRGRIQDARKKFEAVWNAPEARDDTRATAAYYLALAEPAKASEWLNKAGELIKEDLGTLNNISTAKDWFDWLKEVEAKNPGIHTALKNSQELSAILAMIWMSVGRTLLKYKEFKKAIEALRVARTMCQPSDSIEIDSILHEAYLQSGDLSGADEIFKDVFKDTSRKGGRMPPPSEER